MEFIPSNWLYNAGVIGFLRVLESAGENKVNVENFLKEDGGVEIDDIVDILFTKNVSKPKPLNKLYTWHWHYVDKTYEWAYSSIGDYIILQLMKIKAGSKKSQVLKSIIDKNLNFEDISFEEEVNKAKEIIKDISKDTSIEVLRDKANELYKLIKPKEDFYKYRKSIGFLFSSGGFYQNLFNPSQFKSIDKFVDKFKTEEIFRKNENNQTCNFCSLRNFKTLPIDFQSMSYLFPAVSFVNAYWNLNNNSVTKICSFCNFLIIHFHLSLISLSDNSEIFINAPSFKIMWHLNKYARTLYEKQKVKEVREILGISLIEMSSRLQLELSKWTKMNIEVIVKYKDKIDFFSLPYEVVDVLSDIEVASLLNKIGEFKILNMVLDGKFNEILKFGERVFRIAIKPRNEWGKQERDFINENIKLERNNSNLISFSQNIFKLYALINDKIKKEVLIWT